MVMSYSVNNRHSLDEIDRWMSELPHASGRGSGDDVIKTLGVTVALDGATQFGAAYMNEPYLDVYGEPTSGSMPMNQEKLSAIALLAARHNLRLQFTFAGDAAAEMILEAIEAANEHTSIVERRWLMQHFQHPTPDHVLRTQRLGLHVTGYTAVDYSKGAAVYVDRFGGDDDERWKSVIPTRWWFDARESISPKARTAPTTKRRLRSGSRWCESTAGPEKSLMSPAKQISREEALQMYTLNGARVLFWEDQLGSIEPRQARGSGGSRSQHPDLPGRRHQRREGDAHHDRRRNRLRSRAVKAHDCEGKSDDTRKPMPTHRLEPTVHPEISATREKAVVYGNPHKYLPVGPNE